MEQQAQRQRFLIDRSIPSFRIDVVREKNRFITEQSQKLYNTRRISELDLFGHKFNLEQIFQKHYGKIIRVFFIETEKAIPAKSRLTFEKKFNAWDLMLFAWINEHGGEAAQQTSATTAMDITNALTAAIESVDAVTEARLVADILRVKGFSVWRANTIARTELGMASSFAQAETARMISADVGITLKKQWIPSKDDRTRINHAVMSGSKPIGLEEKFIVGGQRLDRPRDPRGSAGNVINCRCAMVHVTF